MMSAPREKTPSTIFEGEGGVGFGFGSFGFEDSRFRIAALMLLPSSPHPKPARVPSLEVPGFGIVR